jgi:PhzF family phenazine biosynthesis protein
MRIPFTQVDAFADAPFAGNPAAVMPLSSWPDDATLLAIAAENNLSETAFLVPDDSGAADFELRWFTPATEAVMCGHATMASGHVVLSGDPGRDRVRFRTRQVGVLTVERREDGYALALPVWRAEPKPLPEIVAALGLAGRSVETLWHHHRYALVVVEDAATVRALEPDFRALGRDGDVLVIVTAPGDGKDGGDIDMVSRAFAPGCGIDEDPVTGSAHAVLVPYWAGRLRRDTMTAFQASARGGRLGCTLRGDVVELTGDCATVIEGSFLLP